MKRNIFAIIAVSALLCSCRADFMEGMWAGDSYYYPSGIETPSTGDKYDDYADNPFVLTAENNVSTFSVDADGASFANCRGILLRDKYMPSHGAVRIEEFLNYFTFNYEAPTTENIAINSEAAVCPWNPSHRLLRLGIKGMDLEEGSIKPSNYVFLIDVSGSMNSPDKIELLKKGLSNLVDNLRPNDRVSIITYSGAVKKLLESTLASDAQTIKSAISKLVASGVTNGGEAIKMAYEEARANFIEGGNNRIIMGTDGDFNVGVTNTTDLVEMVEEQAKNGIYLTVCGFGRGNLNDSMMEKISNSGNGTYVYVDSEKELVKVFIEEKDRFHAVANDTKCQVTFNPETVKAYRLIGYENRMLTAEDFENDDKDAGEIGAGQTITALYEIEPVKGSYLETAASLGTFDVRYKKDLSGESIPLSMPLVDWNEPSENFNLAAGIAAFGMVLRDSPYKGDSTLEMAQELITPSLDKVRYSQDLILMIQAAKTILGK